MEATQADAEHTLQNPLLTPLNKRAPRNNYALACAIVASMASFLLGYNIGVMSGAQIYIEDDLKITDTQIEILTGIINIFSLAGSLAVGWISDCIGRRKTLALTATIYFIGPLITSIATNYTLLMVGRFITGIAIGYTIIVPVYIAEVSPVANRGLLTSFPELFVNVGILLAYVSNFAFADLPEHLNWRLMFVVGAVPPIILAFSIFAMPESPRWLIMKGRIGMAKEVLIRISDTNDEAEQQLREIKAAVGIPMVGTEEVVCVPKHQKAESLWTELLIKPTPSIRRVLITVLALQFFQQAGGIDTVVLYSPRVFEKAGIRTNTNLLGATVLVGVIKTIFILVAMFLSDRAGRRLLLLASTGGMAVSLIILGFGLEMVDGISNNRWVVAVCIVAVLTYVASFSIGIGPLTGVYSSEILPLKLRAQGMGLGMAMNRVVCGVVTMTYISLYNAITIAGSFFLFAGIVGLSWVFVYFCLPETRGRSLEEMEALFQNIGKKKQERAKNGVGAEGF